MKIYESLAKMAEQKNIFYLDTNQILSKYFIYLDRWIKLYNAVHEEKITVFILSQCIKELEDKRNSDGDVSSLARLGLQILEASFEEGGPYKVAECHSDVFFDAAIRAEATIKSISQPVTVFTYDSGLTDDLIFLNYSPSCIGKYISVERMSGEDELKLIKKGNKGYTPSEIAQRIEKRAQMNAT